MNFKAFLNDLTVVMGKHNVSKMNRAQIRMKMY